VDIWAGRGNTAGSACRAGGSTVCLCLHELGQHDHRHRFIHHNHDVASVSLAPNLQSQPCHLHRRQPQPPKQADHHQDGPVDRSVCSRDMRDYNRLQRLGRDGDPPTARYGLRARAACGSRGVLLAVVMLAVLMVRVAGASAAVCSPHWVGSWIASPSDGGSPVGRNGGAIPKARAIAALTGAFSCEHAAASWLIVRWLLLFCGVSEAKRLAEAELPQPVVHGTASDWTDRLSAAGQESREAQANRAC
jgi:hypothetical protein